MGDRFTTTLYRAIIVMYMYLTVLKKFLSLRFVIAGIFIFSLTGCIFLPQGLEYDGPNERPASLNEYYSVGHSYHSYEVKSASQETEFSIHRIHIDTDYGEIVIDYYKRMKESEDLILVFPVLGGRNLFSKYFADYFAHNGFDTAIVHRESTFKKPENYDKLETLFRENVIRDRIAIDFFEQVYSKKNIGSFGISRGAINAAVTAGVDSRLKYNVFAMGASDIVEVFDESTEGGIERYRKKGNERKRIYQRRV